MRLNGLTYLTPHACEIANLIISWGAGEGGGRARPPPWEQGTVAGAGKEEGPGGSPGRGGGAGGGDASSTSGVVCQEAG